MQRIYTDSNPINVNFAKSLLEQHHIEVQLRNEFAQGGAGELAPTQTWLELWLFDDSQADKARSILQSLKSDDAPNWICSSCQEENAPEFEICWNCGKH